MTLIRTRSFVCALALAGALTASVVGKVAALGGGGPGPQGIGAILLALGCALAVGATLAWQVSGRLRARVQIRCCRRDGLQAGPKRQRQAKQWTVHVEIGQRLAPGDDSR